MEENNVENIETQANNEVKTENKHICFENHCWKMCLAMVLAAFLGGFLAVYFVTDQITERKLSHPYTMPVAKQRFEHNLFNDIEKIRRQNERDMENFERQMINPFMDNRHPVLPDFEIPAMMMNPVKVKTEIENNCYNIKIGLKPFNGDENKINYNVTGRKITVFGNSDVKEKGFEENISFSQDFILPKNADIANITKQKDENKLVISVPLK